MGLFCLATAMIALTRRMELIAAVWPGDALTAAFLVRWARSREERIVTLALTVAASVAANLVGGSTPAMAVLMPALNLVNILVAVAVVRRFGGPVDGLRAFAAFIAGPVVLAPALTGAGAALSFIVIDHAQGPVHLGLRWFFATALGMAIVGPFALTVRLPRSEPSWTWARFAAGQAVTAAGAAAVLFTQSTPPLFLISPFLIAGALSHRELGGVCAVAITALVAWAATLAGRGPALVAQLTGVDEAQLVQVLLVSMVFTVLPISALLRRLDGYARELDARRVRAEELSHVKTRLLAHVSHEIRSPLSGVTGLAELMRDGALGQVTEVQRGTLEEILSSGAEVDQLARDLTDAVAIQSGAAEMRLSAVDAAGAVAAAVNLARFRMSQHQAEIEVVSQPAGLYVSADPLRLRQILVNLLVNAAKYGGRPPRVRVSVSETQRGTVCFEVADNGPGVPAERRPTLFRDFERLGAEKSDLEGWGLGLALSHQMARLQGGALCVGDSELGGALFWVELPAWSGAVAAA